MERNQNGYPIRNGKGIVAPAPAIGNGGADMREKNWRDLAERNEEMQRKGLMQGNDVNMRGCNNNQTGITGHGGCDNDSMGIGSLPLAYAYVPMQKFRLLYNPEKALARGTLFEELDLPLGVYNNGK